MTRLNPLKWSMYFQQFRALLILVPGLLTLHACSDDIEMDIAEVESIAVTKQATMVNINPAQLCSDITLPNKMTGEMIKGTRDCQPKKPDCEKVGDLDCNMADKSLYGLKPTDLKPENIKEGVTIADVEGTMIPDQKACSTDGETDCITSAAFAGASRDDIAARVVENQTVAGTPGAFVPDLPPATAVLADDTVGGTAGQFPFCNDNQAAAPQTGGCALAQNQKAAEPATLNPGDIKSGETINGTTGTFITTASNCSAAGATGCVATGGGSFVAADKSAVVATNLLKGYPLLGVTGTVKAKPGVCNADGDTNCLAQGRYAAIDKSKLKKGILRSGITIGGVTGEFPSANYPLAGAQGNVDDLTSGGFAQALASAAIFEFWDAVGQRHSAAGSTDLSGDHILTGKSIFGVTGTLSERPADCGGDFEEDCVSTATFPAIKRDRLNASIIRKGVTIAGIAGQYPSLAYPLDRQDPGRASHKVLDYPNNVAGNHQLIFWDVNGTAHTIAAAEDLITANVLKDTDILGVTGSAAAMPADCTSHNQTGCVARTSAPAYTAADVKPAVIKGGVQVVTPAGTITGIFPSAAAPLAPLGDDTALTSGNFNTKLRQAGPFVFWDATGQKHTATGDADLTAGNLLNTITVFGLQGTLAVQPADCNTLIDNCVATTSRPTYDKTVLTDKILKAGVKVGNVTGTYPSDESPLPENTEVTNITLANVQSVLSLAAPFEYFDKAGNRYQGNGTTALTGPNIRKNVNIFNRIGSGLESPGVCDGSLQDNCVVQGDYKTLDSTKITATNIKKDTNILGVRGTYPSAGNELPGADDTVTDLAMGNWNTSIASASTFEFWTPEGVRQTATGSTDLLQANLKKGTTFYTVHGTMPVSSGDCQAADALGCTANASFPSYDKVALKEGVVKNGVTVLGVAGKYPSSTYPLTTNPLPSLDGSFNTMMRQDATFQYWDSAGNRYEGTGSSKIAVENIRTGKSIFGITGTAIPVPDLDQWDVLWGISYTDASGQNRTGKAKVNCRNLTDSTTYPNTTDSSYTIDDYNGGLARMPNQNPHGNDKYKCNGDAFEDVSYNKSTGERGTCGDANVTCIYRDRIMGISWLQIESGEGPDTFAVAESRCANKVAGGFSDWRLPTQKEALMAYVHGIRGVHIRSGNDNKFKSASYIWTSTVNSTSSNHIMGVEMAQGITSSVSKTLTSNIHCVR